VKLDLQLNTPLYALLTTIRDEKLSFNQHITAFVEAVLAHGGRVDGGCFEMDATLKDEKFRVSQAYPDIDVFAFAHIDTAIDYTCVSCLGQSKVKLSLHKDENTYIECDCGERCEPTQSTEIQALLNKNNT
jgi:hypothetical protein